MFEVKFTFFRIKPDLVATIAYVISQMVLMLGGDCIYEIKPIEEVSDESA